MKIALGTVQWGMNYGISNLNGVPNDDELNKIFRRMKDVGIDTLDTAISYGNAHKRLREFISSSHKIISKVDPSVNQKTIKEQCLETISSLGQPKLEGSLVHNVKDLFDNQNIWNELSELKERGLIKKIGLSLYDPADLKRILKSGIIPDIVQIPFNILDRRFFSYFSQLKEHGIEIHVRSVFLQGILIIAYNHCPKDFEKWDPHWRIYREWINKNRISPIEACIQHVLSYDSIDKIVIGITSLKELNDIITAQMRKPLRAPKALEITDKKLINPLEWPITKQLLSKRQ
tara:strand:+ start:2069 stop:2935 length:867 start_codon:yes stop_codon:yes gene_type:complete